MSERTAVKSITKTQYVQLVGLFALAKKHYELVEDCRKAAEEITGEREYGHISDAIYGESHTVDEVLKLLGIKVSRP